MQPGWHTDSRYSDIIAYSHSVVKWAFNTAAIPNLAQAQMGKAAMSRSEAAKDMRGQSESSMAGWAMLPCTSRAKEGSLLGLGAPTMGRGSHHLRSEEVQDNIDDQRPVL